MRWLAVVLLGSVIGSVPGNLSATVPPSQLSKLDGATAWINGRANASNLAGKVVILDVFTVDCSNCQNIVPTLRSLYSKDRSRGLTVVGIHSPETPAERSRPYVEQSLARQGIVWPVAIDNDFALWHAYNVQAWPTELFFDRHGTLRKIIVGDSQDQDVRTTVEALLGSAGRADSR
jgi:thiol-disulfide isomerase/thioredoxin